MHYNMSELPQVGPTIILLLDVIEDLIVSKDLLILVIIDGAEELETIRMAVELSVLLFNGLDNVSMESLTILFCIKQQGAANKV